MEKITCPLCHSSEFKVVATRADYTQPFTNVICTECALVYANPAPTSSELEEYYKRGFIQVRHQVQSVEEARERARRKGSAAKYPVTGLVEKLTRGSSVLEIGCSYGFLLNALHAASGCSVQGVEPNEVSGRFAGEEFGISVIQATVEDYLKSQPAGKYDLIIISHVLEHVADPVFVLTALRQELKPGGELYVCVPDVTHLQEPPESFFQVPHLTSFSPWTLHLALQAAGYKIVRSQRNLRKPRSGMEVFAVSFEDSAAAEAHAAFLIGSDPEKVMRGIEAARLQYAFLRRLKKIVSPLIPKKHLEAVSQKIRYWVRALSDRL